MAGAPLVSVLLLLLAASQALAQTKTQNGITSTYSQVDCTCFTPCADPGATCYAAVHEQVTVNGATATFDFTNSANPGNPAFGVCYNPSTGQGALVQALAQETIQRVVVTSTDDCPCPVGVCGDPIITGYDGRAFDFKGEHNKYFNLLSEKNHLVNAKFVDAMLKNHEGNFMGEIGFKYMNQTVKSAINPEGEMSVEINGEEQPFAQVSKDLGNGLLVEVEPHFPQLGHVVVITTPLMVFRVEAIKPFTDAVTGFNRGYLNVLSVLREHPEDMHGILGQTAYTTDYYPLNDMQFHGDGEEMDYIVSSLFAHDSKFNRFTFTGLAPATHAARRLLVSSGPAEKGNQVVKSSPPLMAGHSTLLKHFT